MENAFPNAMAVFFVVKMMPISGAARFPSEKGFDGDHRPIIVSSRKKIRNGNLVGGFNPSEKYDIVSWDDIPNIWKNMFQTTNQ